MNVYSARIDHNTRPSDDETLFNLEILENVPNQRPVVRETHRNLSTRPDSPRYVELVLREDSRLVNAGATIPNGQPGAGGPTAFGGGEDGNVISENDLLGGDDGTAKRGLSAFADSDLFNLMVIPPLPGAGGTTTLSDTDDGLGVYAAAAAICMDRRAMLLVDPKATWTSAQQAADDMEGAFNALSRDAKKNCAAYFPLLRITDPLREGRIADFAPTAAVAGVFARTDVNRGVWKAPAGQTDGALAGVAALSVKMTDRENGLLNPLGLNCLRTFPVIGNVVWGARTLDGDDRLASEWKYIPVRRTALYIEESLLRGTKWAVFEPNDEPLWAQLRSAIGSFMQGLYRQGAFQGQTPSKAYFVKVDSETTTQDDIDRGIVNIHVGFAPLKPAEFVVIRLQQMAGREIA
jgi:hypothetical protein